MDREVSPATLFACFLFFHNIWIVKLTSIGGSSRYSPPHGRIEATPLLRKTDPDDDNVFEDIRAFRTPNTVTIAPTVHHDQNGNGSFWSQVFGLF